MAHPEQLAAVSSRDVGARALFDYVNSIAPTTVLHADKYSFSYT